MTPGWARWALVGLLVAPAAARAETLAQVLPAPHRQRVYDYAGVLTLVQRQGLKERLRQMEAKHTAQGAVVLMNRVEDDSIEGFSNKLLNRWGVGERATNNGFVLVVAIDQRRWRLETGRGLRKKISDAEAAGLMRDNLVPAFKREQYGEGLRLALMAIQSKASGEPVPHASTSTTSATSTTSESPSFGPNNSSGNGLSLAPDCLIVFCFIVGVPIAILLGMAGRGSGGYRGSSTFWNNSGPSGRWNNPGSGGWGHSDSSGWSPSDSGSSSWSSSDSGSSIGSSGDSGGSSSGGDYGGGSGDGGGASGSW